MIRLLGLILFCSTAIPLAAQQRLLPLDESVYQKVIASNKGKLVLVDFWATWCEPCRAELPQLVRLEAKYRSKGFKLITISCDEPEQEADASRFLKQHGTFLSPYVKRVKDDEKFIDSVDATWSGALPALFLYDRSGRRVRSFIGETDMAELEKAIQKLL